MSPHRRYRHGDPRRYLVFTGNRLGLRGKFLLLLGIVWVLVGLSTFNAPDAPEYYLLSHGEHVRSLIWVLTGGFAIACSTLPQGRDRHGFNALYFMAGYRVVAYSCGIPSTGRAWFGLLAWCAICGVIYLAAKVTNPPDLTGIRAKVHGGSE